MGADYAGQETGIEQLREMPKEAKEYLFHHAGNALCTVTLALWMVRTEIEAGVVPNLRRVDMAIEATKHAMDDLQRIERPLPRFEELRSAAATHEHGEAA